MEVWKAIKGFEGYYEVSNLGRVRSLDRYVNHNFGGKRFCKGQLLKPTPDKDGYHRVNLKIKQKGSISLVHRLVAYAFIPNPENKPQVNHINGIKHDNRIENLEWCTLSENRQHAYDTNLQNGINRRGCKSNFAKLSESDVKDIRNLYKGDLRLISKNDRHKYLSTKKIAKKYNVSAGAIQAIISGKTWNWLK